MCVCVCVCVCVSLTMTFCNGDCIIGPLQEVLYMLKNRLYLFTPVSVPGIIIPEQTGLINESSEPLVTMSKDTPWVSG